MSDQFYQVFIDNARRQFEVRGPMADEDALKRKSELEKNGRTIERFAIKADVPIKDITTRFATNAGLRQVDDLSG